MPLAPGDGLLHYRLAEQIGEGGMGVVWRATDTTLDREVAIKILPEVFAADPERLARFEREAKLLASLNHANIAAVYGLHEFDGTHFLAMELVEGEDMASHLARGRLPTDEALEIAAQVLEALSAAHEQGVIHRDLKPANIQLGLDGKVKVLDFGLAKMLEATAGSEAADLSLSPTMTAAMTRGGVVLGTAAYMSPEQARGKPLDRRTDLWSFGCVLFEMLTGQPAFAGETATDVLSAVISREPDLDALPAETPGSIRRLLERCLAKDARHRLSDAADARLEIEEAERPPTEQVDSVAERRRRDLTTWLPWVVATTSLLLALLAWLGNPGREQESTRETPTVVGIEALTPSLGPEYMPALSPDGRNLAYVARSGSDFDIFLLRVGGENPINLTADHEGWDGAPEFSPDGERIAFSSERDGGGLYVMGATGEFPRKVADEGTHPSWSPDGTRLVAATEQVNDPYSRSTRSRVFILDLESGQTRNLPVGEDGVGPRWSPDGRHIAFWHEIDGQRDLLTIAIDGDAPTQVTSDPHTDWEPMWAEGGRALYFHSDRGGSANLWRIPMNPQTGEATGPPTPLTIGVTPVWESSLSADGTRLVGSMRDESAAIQAYGFDPKEPKILGDPRTILELTSALHQAQLSSDGRLLLFRTVRPREIVTTLDLVSGELKRLISDEYRNRGPVLAPDGRWLALYSNRDGLYQLWLVRPDGTDLHRVYESSSSDPAWSPDGQRIALAVAEGGKTRWNDTRILMPDPAAADDLAPWIPQGEPIEEFAVELWSPDGRFLVGSTDLPQQLAIYDLDSGALRSYPEPLALPSFNYSFFPDGERLVYWDDRLDSAAVWDTETGSVELLPGVETQGDTLLSPDGNTLYVVERRVDGEIWLLTLAGGARFAD